MKKKSSVFILILFLIVIGGVFAYSYVTYNDDYLSDVEGLSSIEDEIKSLIPNEVDSNLNFNDFLPTDNNVKVSFISKDEKLIDKNGNVFRPSYLSTNQEVIIEVVVEIVPKNGFASIYYSILGGAKREFKITVIVLKNDLTAEDKLQIIEEQLFVPKITKTDIGLIEEIFIFPDVEISWKSNNESIITNSGVVNNTGSANLEATLKIGELQKVVSFPIEVVDEFANIVEVNEGFEFISLSNSYNTVDETSNFLIHEAILNTEDNNKFLRMRAHTDSTFEYLHELTGAMSLSFDYWAITSSSFNNDVYIYIETKNSDNTWTVFSSYKINDNEKHLVNLNLSSLPQQSKLRIRTYADYSTMFIALDNFKIERKVNTTDIDKSLSSIIPKNLSTSHILPLSTPYGGKISWTSNQPDIIDNNGVVKQPDDLTKVQLTASITGVLDNFSLDYFIDVFGLNYVVPVEIFFIDIGKYGAADPGESIYFKIGEIDILVDSGDNINATKQAISEVIDENSEDKILDYVIATHPDADHIGGMKYIFDTYDIENVVYFEGDHDTNVYRNFLNSVNNKNLVSECTILEAYNNLGDCKRVIELAPGVTIEFVDTGYYSTTEPNGRSIVFVLEAYGTKLLMTGDADNAHGRTLESNYMNQVGKIDILKMVHHGSREGTSSEFLSVVDPDYVIIANGNYFGNRHGHPTPEAINRVYKNNPNTAIYAIVGGDALECTLTTSYRCEEGDRFVDRNGTINLKIDSNGFNFKSEYNEVMIEISTTHFWRSHPLREYEHKLS